MTWTFYPQLIASSTMMKVRAIIGDTLRDNPQIEDEEINFFLTLRANIWGAAAECCRALASKYSRSADLRSGDTERKYSQLATAYALRAQQFDAKAAASGAGMPYCGGISQADKENQQQDPDRVNPQFALGMFDSNLPVSQLSQTATGQTDENS